MYEYIKFRDVVVYSIRMQSENIHLHMFYHIQLFVDEYAMYQNVCMFAFINGTKRPLFSI